MQRIIIDNEFKDKFLKLAEIVKEHCDQRYFDGISCRGCPFYLGIEKDCKFKEDPRNWIIK